MTTYVENFTNETKKSDTSIISKGKVSNREYEQSRYHYYIDNGGTIIAIAGDDYVVCVCDTRLSSGFSIKTRNHPKYTQLTNTCILLSSGMQSDINILHKTILYEISMYRFKHSKSPTVEAIAQLLSTTLYSRRFLPFYSFCILAGLDNEGKGAIFDYDSIGSYERSSYSARGSGGDLAASLLDNQLKRDNQSNIPEKYTKVEIMRLAVDTLAVVSERDIYTGDIADVIVADRAEVSINHIDLRKD